MVDFWLSSIPIKNSFAAQLSTNPVALYADLRNRKDMIRLLSIPNVNIISTAMAFSISQHRMNGGRVTL